MTNNILDLIQSNLTSSVVETMAGRIGGDNKATGQAASSAVAILLSALNKSAQNPKRNSGLLGALENDHDGSILDNLMDFAKGSDNLSPRTTNGAGILKHLLGDNIGNAAEILTKSSGLSKDKSASLLSMLAPIVMGAVGKNLRQAPQTNTNILSDILSSAVKSNTQGRQEMSIFEKLLDQDGDGSILDDVLSMGMKFFSRRK